MANSKCDCGCGVNHYNQRVYHDEAAETVKWFATDACRALYIKKLQAERQGEKDKPFKERTADPYFKPEDG